ncbi:MAG TPA: tyrosine-type recombinase/integrase [Acidimicrobiales bacterium]|nr:tyrosine-type recombinase/integrase [Acidimicrobiales bacterium]
MSRQRGHGDGSIYRRAVDGLWMGFVTVGNADGRQVRRYVTARSRAVVVEKLEALRSAQNAGLSVPNPRTTVGEYLVRWLADIVPDSVGSVNTLDNYEWAVRLHLVPALGHRPLVKLTPADVVEMLRAKISAGMARNTVMRLRSILASALDQALIEGLVVRNVAAITKPPKGGTVPHGRSLDVAEARALLKAAKGSRLEAAFVTMLMLGLRPGEALGLRWEDLDTSAGTLRVERALKRERGALLLGPTKTRRSRRALGVPSPVIKALAVHRRRQAKERLRAGPAWQDNDLIFPTALGTLLDPSNFRREFNRVCTAADLGHWHPHELRHSAVSLLSASGVPIELVADVMGHTTTRTTEAIYRHNVLPTATGAVQAMDNMFED